ncbi:MAG: hypothetical protein P8M72_04380 [Gammaproteobacteria bacterium]|nr:hypothetical protein [Gammaproteobacteria bacterium]
MKSYPKYVREQKGNLYYQRDYPKKLQSIAGAKTYKNALGLKANNHSQTQLSRAIADASELFDIECRLHENSTPGAFQDNELDKAAADLVSRLHIVSEDSIDDLEEALDAGHLDLPGWHQVTDEMKAASYESREPKLTPRQEATWRAFKAIQNQFDKKPLIVRNLWDEYIKFRGLNPDDREDGRIIRRGERILSFIGEHSAYNPKIVRIIESGLEAYYVHERSKIKSNGGKRSVQGIKRDQNEIVAAINRGASLNHLGWKVKAQHQLDKTDPKEARIDLDKPVQIQLVNSCLEDKKTPHLSTVILIELQCGAMASEIKRLDFDEAMEELNAPLPMLKIGRKEETKTKTEERRRVAPIVIGVEYIKEHLEQTLKWLNRTSESNHSTMIKRKLVEVTGIKEASAHCLRHTIRANAESNDINHSHTSSICGWSGGALSKNAITYGIHRLSTHKGFLEIRESSLKMHQFILDTIEEPDSNVVNIHRS